MNVLGLIGVSGVATASHAVIGTLTCATILGCELPHRIAGLRSGSVSLRTYAAGAARIACRCAPELLGVTVCLMGALALRARGDVDEVFHSEQEVVAWEQIKKEWPILCGADTLLNFQTWLRLIVLMFVAARAKAKEAVPLAGMAAVLFLAAMTARAALAVRTANYRLEGPLALGGDLAIACEVAMLPRLAWLSVGAFRETPVAATTWVGVTAWFASFHYFNFAANSEADKLFTLAHALETTAAFAYMLNTIIAHFSSQPAKRGASAGFMHLVMPFQAALAAYYWLTAIEPHPSLVGAGRPFCLLAWGNLLQLGAYITSAAFFIAGYFDTDGSGQGVGATVNEQPLVVAGAPVVDLPSSEMVDASAHDVSSALEAAREMLVL